MLHNDKKGTSFVFFRWIGTFSTRFWKEILLITVLVSILMGYLATNTRIETDLTVLLPEDDPYSQKYKELFSSDSIGDSLVIVVKTGGDRKEAYACAQEIKTELEQMVDIVHFFRKTDAVSMMGSMGVMLTNADVFTDLSRTLDFVDFVLTDPMQIDFKLVREAGIAFYKIQTLFDDLQDMDQIDKYAMLSQDGEAMVLNAVLTKSAVDFDFTVSAISTLRKKVEEITSRYGFSFGFSGNYQVGIDTQKVVGKDFQLTTLFALVTITILFFLVYGNLFITIAVFLSLVTAGLFSLGVFYLLFGTLEFTSSFVLALLFGLGIDFAIHMANRTNEYISQHNPSFNTCPGKQKRGWTARALREAIQSSGKSVFIGALTTIAAFFSLVLVDSPGLQRIGLLAGVGIFIYWVVMVFILPAWLLLFAPFLRFFPTRRRMEKHLAGLALFFRSKKSIWLPICIVVLCIPALFFMVQNFLGFDFTPASIVPEDLESKQMLDLMSEKDLSFSVDDSVVAFLDDPTKLPDAEKRIFEECSHLDRIISLGTTIPASLVSDYSSFKEKATKLMDESQNAFTLVLLKKLRAYDDMKAWLDLLVESPDFSGFSQRMFSSTLLPKEASQFFTGELDGKMQLKMYIISSEDIWRENRLKVFLQELNQTEFSFFGYPVIYYRVMQQVISAITISILIASVIIGITVVLGLKNFSDSLFVISALGLTIVFFYGLSYLLGFHVNFMTFLALPLLMGIGIDGPVHLLHRIQEENKKNQSSTALSFSQMLKEVVFGTGLAVTLSAFTTAVAFFSFSLASSPLLREFGISLGIGVLVNWAISLGWVLVLKLRMLRHPDQTPAEAPIPNREDPK